MGVPHQRKYLPPPVKKQTQKDKRMNCKNCGAPLPISTCQQILYADNRVIDERGTKCEYCGTRIN